MRGPHDLGHGVGRTWPLANHCTRVAAKWTAISASAWSLQRRVAGVPVGLPSPEQVDHGEERVGSGGVVRRERPHPGAQLTFTDIGGWRFQAFATDTHVGQIAALEARHRGHATVEDHIRCGKDTGLGRFPSRQFNVNAAWLELALTAVDLIAWTHTTLLHGELAKAEPKTLRYPAAARGRPHHPRRTTSLRAHRRTLALAARAGRRLRPPRRPPTAATHLTARPTDRHHRGTGAAGKPFRQLSHASRNHLA
jgi:Transposase DDE domain group 1